MRQSRRFRPEALAIRTESLDKVRKARSSRWQRWARLICRMVPEPAMEPEAQTELKEPSLARDLETVSPNPGKATVAAMAAVPEYRHPASEPRQLLKPEQAFSTSWMTDLRQLRLRLPTSPLRFTQRKRAI